MIPSGSWVKIEGREFKKSSDPLFDDCNFFEGSSGLQAALIDTEDRLDKVEKWTKAERLGMQAALYDSEQRVQKLTEQLSVSR